ncbi:MAG: hypothetical protein Q8L48_08950 [Archangium sp.]|nr:hypothetical protein [Archangium sp.]
MADEALQGWRRHVFGPGAGRTAVLLATVLSLPFCFVGLFADDYFHQLAIERAALMPVTPWDLFTFAWGDPARLRPIIERGPYSWWTLPELKFSFLRPLTCALANFDALAFGRAFFFHHLHSVAWHVALVAVVAALFRRALGPVAPLAGLAALLFTLDDAHTVVAGWIANRNALVSTVAALLGVLAHVRWREQGWRPGLPLSLLGCAVGLSAGETALGAIAYLVAYELTAAPGPWRTRLRSLVPIALLGAGYIALYRASGSGAYGSEIYVDPMREPLRFLVQAPAKALALIGAQFLGATADLWMVRVAARPLLAATGVLALVLMVVLARRVWPRLPEPERRGVRWLTLGAAFSLVPVLATFPLNRLLLMPSIGGSALVAVVLLYGWRAAGDRLLRAGARLLFVMNVVVGLLGWPAAAVILKLGADEQTRSSLETKLSDEALAGRVVIFVAPDPAASLYVPMVRAWHHKPLPRSWNTLSFAPFAHRLTRTGPDTVELEVVDGRMLETVFEQLMRGASFPLPLGMKVKLEGSEVTVVGLNEGLPNRISLRFDENPDLGGYTIAQWENGELAPLRLPAVGQTLELPRLHSLLAP